LKAREANNTFSCFAYCLAYLVEVAASGGNIMKAFIAAVICAAAIGVAASYALHTQQETVDVAFSTSGARVGNPGHNLIVN
jgi:predicted ribosomally synthesized peptide with SipW-like signal peptide